MKRQLSILFAIVAATVITALAHTSHVLGNGAVGIDYGYNLRGWTTNVTSNVFSQLIHFQDPPDGGTPCFNGNIIAIVWLQGEAGNQLIKTGGFSYYYDELDRLVAANFRDHSERDFSCQYEYDIQGNATRVSKYGITDRIDAGGTTSCSYGVIDDVTLTYNGNRLVCADDAADALVYAGAMDFHDGANEQTEYAYDANGNLTKDLNRGIESITYDRNNMPTEITFTSGARTCYTYDADGRKLRVSHYGRRGEKRDELDYIGDMVLRNGALERTLTPNGYIVNDTVYYYVKDYQGNVRNVVREDGVVVESNEYYPYGGLFSAIPSVQPYKYGAKELDRTHGLDWYDFGARMHDAMLTRWGTIDPFAEKYYTFSPYIYCAANPIKFVDPTGKNAVISVEGNIITIQVNIYIQGASAELLKAYYENIMQNWGAVTSYTDLLTGNEYTLNWQVSVKDKKDLKDDDRYNPANNFYITISGNSSVTNTSNGFIRSDFSKRPNPMAHEFGHNLGLRDRYENSKYYEAPGSQGDIMYEEAGKGKVSAQTMLPVVQPALFNHNIGKLFGKRKTVFHINKTYREPRIRKQKPIPNK